MSGTATLRITPAVAACIGSQATKDHKLAAARGEVTLFPGESGIVLLYLCYDADDEVRSLARHRLLHLPLTALLEIIDQQDVHPRVLDLIARCHYRQQDLVDRLMSHPALAEGTAVFLTEKLGQESVPSEVSARQASPTGGSAAAVPLDEEEEYDEDSEEHQSKYQLAQIFGVSDKIKMALTGDKEWRTILIKDANKQVSGAVIKNPRITEGEVLSILKGSIQNDEILRVICSNKEWVKNYQIRKALVENHRTPLQTALRYLATLGDKDIAFLAKSKSVSTVISTQAKRLLMQKKRD